MERRWNGKRPIATGLAVAAILGVLLAVYVGAYWWRLPSSITHGHLWNEATKTAENVVLRFPTAVETAQFSPLVISASR